MYSCAVTRKGLIVAGDASGQVLFCDWKYEYFDNLCGCVIILQQQKASRLSRARGDDRGDGNAHGAFIVTHGLSTCHRPALCIRHPVHARPGGPASPRRVPPAWHYDCYAGFVVYEGKAYPSDRFPALWDEEPYAAVLRERERRNNVECD